MFNITCFAGPDESSSQDVAHSRQSSDTVMSSYYSFPAFDLATESLVSCRQAVEMLCLDPSLVDYLVQNGVLTRSERQLLLDANEETVTSSLVRRNLVLLKCVDSVGQRGLQLLLNALRHTSQYTLANILDVGQRILPVEERSSESMKKKTFLRLPVHLH